jgi:hypothetical protein
MPYGVKTAYKKGMKKDFEINPEKEKKKIKLKKGKIQL